MSKSGRRDHDAEVEETVLERLPRWRRELLRIRDRARAREEEEAVQRRDRE